MSKVVLIVGPTATGKSSLGVELAEKYNGEIINGDSVAVYEKLDIGSAKITPQQQRGIVHHLLGYKKVEEDYSVAHFQMDGRQAIEEISQKNKLPIVAGGTGLYIKALLYDYQFKAEEGEKNSYEDCSTEQLYEMLKKVDEKSWQQIHAHNRKRIIRALQIAEGGYTKSEIEASQKHEAIYDHLLIGLTMNRDRLKERINQRVDQMMEEGLLEEVKGLFEEYSPDLHCFSAIGYKEFRAYFTGEQTLEETVELIKTHTRQFAKRQFTWFNNQLDINWFDVEEADYQKKIEERIEEFIGAKEV